MNIPAVKITLQGEQFWFLPDTASNNGGPIAPLDHCSEEGKLGPTFPLRRSYAHVINGRIYRHGVVIGKIAPLLGVHDAEKSETR